MSSFWTSDTQVFVETASDVNRKSTRIRLLVVWELDICLFTLCASGLKAMLLYVSQVFCITANP